MREEFECRNERADSATAKGLRHGFLARREHLGRCGVAILTLALTLCASGFVHAQNQKNKNKKKDAEPTLDTASLLPENQAIDLLVTQMLGAWQAGDAEGMHKFYADDITVISGAWEPPLFGWANYVRGFQAQYARTSGSRLERTNSYTKVMGDTALVTYQWQFLGTVDGRRTQAFGHTTLVLQKRTGNWLIVLNHTSVIPTDEPSAGAPTPASGEPTSSLAPNRK